MGMITNKRLKPVQPRPKSNSHPPLTTAGGRLGVGRFVTSPVDWFKITLVRRATRAADLASSSPRPLPESVLAASRPVHLPDPAVPTDPQTPASRWTVVAARRACGWLQFYHKPRYQAMGFRGGSIEFKPDCDLVRLWRNLGRDNGQISQTELVSLTAGTFYDHTHKVAT